MGNEWHVGSARGGPNRGAPTVTVQKKLRLVFYPGDRGVKNGTTLGTIYVVGGGGEQYEACGGPPPGSGYADRGGHTADETPAGIYVLDYKEHHTTMNWPMSVIPWGAPLRLEGGELEYQVKGKWIRATGPDGTVTKASLLFAQRTHRRALSEAEKAEVVTSTRDYMIEAVGPLPAIYQLNDFGEWAFNLTRGGSRTAYYVHTTPDDERATREGRPFELTQSHGCVHVRPADRAEMMQKGYLKKGVTFEVRRYDEVGPPR